MLRLVFGILLLCGGVAITTLGGYLAKDGWDAIKKTTLLAPCILIDISPSKILSLKNIGCPVENISVFSTQYVLKDPPVSNPSVEIDTYKKPSGAIKKIPLLKANDEVKIDLTALPFVSFYDNPAKGETIPLFTYYCFRITYVDAKTGTKGVIYKTTSSYTKFPSLIENPENVASAGTTWADFMHDIPSVLEAHQKRIFGDQ